MKYDICYYMGEPQNHAYQRKLHSKHHVLYDSIHVKCKMSRKSKLIRNKKQISGCLRLEVGIIRDLA